MELLERNGIHASVLDMYCLKPLDRTTLLEEAADAKLVITVEEHAPSGGLGSMVCQTLSADNPKKSSYYLFLTNLLLQVIQPKFSITTL